MGSVDDVVKMVLGRRGVASAATVAPLMVFPVKFTRESAGMDKIAVVPDGVMVSLLSVTVICLKSVVLQVVEPRAVDGQSLNANGTVLTRVPLTTANGVTTVRVPEAMEPTVARVAVVPDILEISWILELTLSATVIALFIVVKLNRLLANEVVWAALAESDTAAVIATPERFWATFAVNRPAAVTRPDDPTRLVRTVAVPTGRIATPPV